MAFWGVVLKPGKAARYSCSNAKGKLKITKATLGRGGSTGKRLIRCKVIGSAEESFLCVLIPNEVESCSLNVVFGDKDVVLFSVIGPPNATVHLTGYLFGDYQPSDHQPSFTRYISEPLGFNVESTDDEEEDSDSDSESDMYTSDSGPSAVAASHRRAKMKSDREKEQQLKKKKGDIGHGYLLSVWTDSEED